MSRISGDLALRARALMERVLRDGGSLEPEYPLVFREGFPGRVLALCEEGEVRSACGLLVRDLVAGGVRVRAGLIGSVATDPEHRGRGHATRLLQQAEAALIHDGCALALLWADDPSFYAGRGWRQVGCELDFVLEPDLARALPAPHGARAAAGDDSGALHRLYLNHAERAERSPEETRALLAGPAMETLVLQHGGRIEAYTCMGRGEDLARTVHEWGGSTGGVLALLAEHLRRAARRGEREPLFLMAPPTAGVLREALARVGAPSARGVLALGKLLDPEAAALLLAELVPGARTGVEARLRGSSTDLRVLVDGPAGSAELDPAQLLDVLLPAAGDRAAVERLAATTGLDLTALPLPLYLWGLDSI